MFCQVSLSLSEGVSEVILGVVVVVKADFDLTSRGLTQLSDSVCEIRVVFLNWVEKRLFGRVSCGIFE